MRSSKAFCSTCKLSKKLRPDGTLHAHHDLRRNEWVRCEGSWCLPVHMPKVKTPA